MKHYVTAIKLLLFMTFLTGLAYPALIFVIGKIAFAKQIEGGLIFKNQTIVGAENIAQEFHSPRYFQPRPSAIDFNAMNSGASNFGLTSEDLAKKISERAKAGATGDMLYASGSGLDPDISPASALAQAKRVAEARGVSEDQIRGLIAKHILSRQFSLLGEPRVNVLMLNLDLDQR